MLAREGDRFISLLGTLARGDTLGGAGIRSWTKPARGVTTGIEGRQLGARREEPVHGGHVLGARGAGWSSRHGAFGYGVTCVYLQ